MRVAFWAVQQVRRDWIWFQWWRVRHGTVQVVHGPGYRVLHHVLDELLHRGVLAAVDIPRDGDDGLDRGLQDKGLWQGLCGHRTGRVRTRREVLHKRWVHREWLLAHEVGWRSTGEYNG